MFSELKKIFNRKPGHLTSVKQQEDSKKFVLSHKEKQIGFLLFKNESWEFQYSNGFKNQTTLQALVEFPDKHKTYRSKELWSFFASRIPSKTNAKTEVDVARDMSLADLLEKFGKHTVNNPFILKPH